MAAAKRTKASKSNLDAIELLMSDHKNVERLFRQFEKLHEAEQDTDTVIEVVREALTVHSRLEKEIFYPAIRKIAGDAEEELLDEAEVEHATVDQLLRALAPGRLKDKKREAHFSVLVEYVRHHVKEEEQEMFPKVKKLKRVDLEKVGAEMESRKTAIKKKLGIA